MRDNKVQNIIVNPDNPDELLVSNTEDITGLIDVVTDLRNWGGHKTTDDMWHLAEFPGVLIEKYCFDNKVKWGDWFSDPIHCRRMLNDPSLAAFRIMKGTA